MSVLPAGRPATHGPATLSAVRGRATITVPEAAELLGVGRNAAYEAIHRGEVPSLKFGARIVVPVAPLLRLLGVDQ